MTCCSPTRTRRSRPARPARTSTTSSPPQTLLIQNPAALTKDASAAAKAFLDFQLGKQGQTDYAEQGFRPLDDSIKVDVKGANDPSDPFPTPQTLLTIDEDFGGWAERQHEVLRREGRHRHQAARAVREVLSVTDARDLIAARGSGDDPDRRVRSPRALGPAAPSWRWASRWSGSACSC